MNEKEIRTAKQNDFEASREHGKLVFKVKNSASATPDIVKSYKFQENNIPTTLYLVQKADGSWEQALSELYKQCYKVGEVHKFCVLNMNKGGWYSLVDDATELSFSQIRLGQHKIEKFARIMCRIVEIKDDTLLLEYVESAHKEDEGKRYFTVNNLLELGSGNPVTNRTLLYKILGTKIFSDVEVKLDSQNSEWIVNLLETAINSLPAWINRRSGMIWLAQVRELAIKLIEQSEYLEFFPDDKRLKLHVRLSEVIDYCDDYKSAKQLIKDNQHIEFVNNILHPLKTSGWLYKPDKKMRLLMALFAQRTELAGQYIGDIFTIIKDNYDDRGFIEKYGQMFVRMLRIYIDAESKTVSDSERDTLLSLIEATAILLLLCNREDFEPWDSYRGRLYSLALLQNRQSSDALVNKALASFAGTLNQPLEYGWADLADIALLCSSRLGLDPLKVISLGLSRYEQGNMVVTLSNLNLKLTDQDKDSDKSAFDLKITSAVTYDVVLANRLANRSMRSSKNLSNQHLLWNEIERHLQTSSSTKTATKLIPESGETVQFIILDNNGPYDYKCLIIDEAYLGCKATLNWSDIMALPLDVPADNFRSETGYWVFEGCVMGLLKDGRIKLSLAKMVADEIKSMAEKAKDQDKLIDAIITKGGDSGCLAFTFEGYTICIPTGSYVEGQKVSVKLTKVKPQANCRVYIEAEEVEVTEIMMPEDVEAENIESATIFLETLAKKEEYALSDAESLTGADSVEEKVDLISAENIHNIGRLLEILAIVEQEDIVREYSLLALSRMLMLATLDTYRARIIDLKMSMLEAMSKFATDGRIDNQKADDLFKQEKDLCATDHDLQRRMTLLKVLASLDRPGILDDKTVAIDPSDTSTLGKVSRLALAYNALRFLQMNDVRKHLLDSIVTLLNLPKPKVDSTRLNVVEDQYNEFKSSIIYPADNGMHANEHKQGREICEVICGMMNADGGTLYLGVNNSGVPTGLDADFLFLNRNKPFYDQADMEDKFKLKFTYALRTQLGLYVEGRRLFPDYVSIEFDELESKRYAVVTVKKFTSHDKVRLTDGTAWIRQDTSTLPILKK